MVTQPWRSYNALINDTFDAAYSLAAQSENENGIRGISGFCELNGPTGSGKTSAIYSIGYEDGVVSALEHIKKCGYQSIFITHRINILIETFKNIIGCKDSNGKPLTASILYKKSAHVVSAVMGTPLPHEEKAPELGKYEEVLHDLRTKALFVDKENKICDELLKNCHEIWKLADKKQDLMSNARSIAKYKNEIEIFEEKITSVSSVIEKLILKNMSLLYKEWQKKIENVGEDNEVTLIAEQKWKDFRKNAWIRRIFPAIAWQDDKQHLLIMTTHKMFGSFYDGTQRVRITNKELSGKVIFIDELDYQSDVLQSMLAQSQEIQEPLEFLGQLITDGKNLVKRRKNIEGENQKKINSKLAELIEYTENILNENNIDLTTDRALIVDDAELKDFGSQYLFRCENLITSKRISLKNTEEGHELSFNQPASIDEEDTLIGTVLALTEKVINRFQSIISVSNFNTEERLELLNKFCKVLFNPQNDNKSAQYAKTLPTISAYQLPHTSLIELNRLKQNNIIPHSQANLGALVSWHLLKSELNRDIDPKRILVRRAYLPAMPEGLLVDLASRNLVFGLSATSYLERALNSFDFRWVRSAMHYLADVRNPRKKHSFLGNALASERTKFFSKSIPYFQSDNDKEKQEALIKYLKNQKKAIRKTKTVVNVCDVGQSSDEVDRQEIIENLPSDFFDAYENKAYEHREKLFLKFIDVIHKAGNREEHKGQIAFANSFKYIKKWMCEDIAKDSRACCDWLTLEKSSALPFLKKYPEISDAFFPVVIHGNKFIILFLESRVHKSVGFSQAYQSAFDTGRNVLVLTQNQSASNGVNLDFHENNANRDLSCLYLLEAKHFFFATNKDSQLIELVEDDEVTTSDIAHIGYQLRNLDKLLKSGDISAKEHKRSIAVILKNEKFDLRTLNDNYKKTEDYSKNIAADVQQQIGRIERCWAEIPEIIIDIDIEMAGLLNKFSHTIDYQNHQDIISSLNNTVIAKIQDYFADATENQAFEQLMLPQQTGERAADIIDNHLIPALREARNQVEDNSGIGRLWRKLGFAILKRDYLWRPDDNTINLREKLYEWACIKIPAGGTPETLWYDAETWQFFAQKRLGLREFNLTAIYSPIANSKALSSWFTHRGYPTSAIAANPLEQKYVFHPKVVQRLLQARIGEEAIRAYLKAEHITTSAFTKDMREFELFDFQVINKPIFIDAKFWHRQTLDEVDNGYFETQQSEDISLPRQIQRLVDHAQVLQKLHGKNAKLVVANFIGRDKSRSLQFFDINLNPVEAERAVIIMLDGCRNPLFTGDIDGDISLEKETTNGFSQLVSFINHYENKELR